MTVSVTVTAWCGRRRRGAWSPWRRWLPSSGSRGPPCRTRTTGPGQLSPELRRRVLETARQLGYPGPDPVARSLRTRRAGVIGLLLTEALSYAFRDPAAIGGHIGHPPGDRGERSHPGQHRRRAQRQHHRDRMVTTLRAAPIGHRGEPMERRPRSFIASGPSTAAQGSSASSPEPERDLGRIDASTLRAGLRSRRAPRGTSAPSGRHRRSSPDGASPSSGCVPAPGPG